jgi:hypothetical protein
MWRLYLYYFTFAYEEAIRGASLLRYLGSYCLVFCFISCVYIKKTYFEIEDSNLKDTKLYSFLFIGSLFIATSSKVIHTILRIKQTPLEFEIRNHQLKIVKQLIIDNYEIKFNFENKPNSLSCYYINYKLAPYLKYNILTTCIKQFAIQKEFLKESVDYTFDYDNKISNDRCKIIYSPFMNKLDMKCM